MPNEPLNIWTQHLTPNNFIHCRAQRDAKYMSPTLTTHTIILRFFIHCRAKRAAKYMNSTLNATQIFPLRRRQTSRLVWWIKVALHSVVVLLFWLICLQTVDLSINLLSKQPLLRSNWPLVLIKTTFDRINSIPTGHTHTKKITSEFVKWRLGLSLLLTSKEMTELDLLHKLASELANCSNNNYRA